MGAGPAVRSEEALIHRRAWRTRTDVEIEVAARVGWYNHHHRIYRALGDIPPAEYETNHYASIKAAVPDRS